MAYGILKCDTVTFTDAGIDKSVTLSGLVQNPTFSGNVTVTGTISGVTVTGATANFISGVFSTQISGTTVTGTTASFTSGVFTNISGGTHTITSGVFALGSATNPSISFTSDPDTGLYSPGADQLALSTNGTGRLFVDANGVITIGASSTGFYISPLTGSSAYLATDSASTAADFVFGTSTSIPIRFIANNTERLRITSAGLVGIGTTSPITTLHVDGTGAQYLRTSSSTYSNFVQTFAGNGSTGVEYKSVYRFVDTDNGERASIDSSGRLLVGTSTATSISSFSSKVEVQTAAAEYMQTWIRHAGTTAESAPTIQLGRSRGTTLNSVTAVANGDALGYIQFLGANGTDFSNIGAQISATVDAEPFTSGDTTDLPSRLVFSVTPDGGSSPTTSPSAMTIKSGQEVLIGYSTDNGAYKLQVNSQIFATSATIATSDGRYKENVATLDGCVDLVKALRPVSFDWKAQEPVTRVDEDGETVVVREAHNFPDGKQVGFIAQEVEEVLADKPWLGSVIKQNVRPAITDADGNELAPEEEFLGIAEGNLVAVLTSALKDAIGRIESLEAEVAALKA